MREKTRIQRRFHKEVCFLLISFSLFIGDVATAAGGVGSTSHTVVVSPPRPHHKTIHIIMGDVFSGKDPIPENLLGLKKHYAPKGINIKFHEPSNGTSMTAEEVAALMTHISEDRLEGDEVHAIIRSKSEAFDDVGKVREFSEKGLKSIIRAGAGVHKEVKNAVSSIDGLPLLRTGTGKIAEAGFWGFVAAMMLQTKKHVYPIDLSKISDPKFSENALKKFPDGVPFKNEVLREMLPVSHGEVVRTVAASKKGGVVPAHLEALAQTIGEDDLLDLLEDQLAGAPIATIGLGPVGIAQLEQYRLINKILADRGAEKMQIRAWSPKYERDEFVFTGELQGVVERSMSLGDTLTGARVVAVNLPLIVPNKKEKIEKGTQGILHPQNLDSASLRYLMNMARAPLVHPSVYSDPDFKAVQHVIDVGTKESTFQPEILDHPESILVTKHFAASTRQATEEVSGKTVGLLKHLIERSSDDELSTKFVRDHVVVPASSDSPL